MVVVASRVVRLVQIGCIEDKIDNNGFCSTTNVFFTDNPYEMVIILSITKVIKIKSF